MTIQTRTRFAATLLAAVAAASMLPACAPLIVAGAVAGGGMVALDRRTGGTQVDDQAIELKGAARARDLATLGNVNVTSYNRLVLLSGEVPTENDKARVEESIRRVENVRSVVNELVVGANSSLGDRSRDSLTSTKVKATLVEAKDMQANAIKVITERGTVFLMGLVTEREANRASDIARTVPGVQKVVRVFEVITEEELAGTVARQQPAGSKP